jgi:hypothetical protein
MRKEIKDLDMGVFYKISDKQLLKDRSELFKEVGIPGLKKMLSRLHHLRLLGVVSITSLFKVTVISLQE